MRWALVLLLASVCYGQTAPAEVGEVPPRSEWGTEDSFDMPVGSGDDTAESVEGAWGTGPIGEDPSPTLAERIYMMFVPVASADECVYCIRIPKGLGTDEKWDVTLKLANWDGDYSGKLDWLRLGVRSLLMIFIWWRFMLAVWHALVVV